MWNKLDLKKELDVEFKHEMKCEEIWKDFNSQYLKLVWCI